jgi:hypothetical protein
MILRALRSNLSVQKIAKNRDDIEFTRPVIEIAAVQLGALNRHDAGGVAELPFGWRDAVPVQLVQERVLGGRDPRRLSEQGYTQASRSVNRVTRLAFPRSANERKAGTQ